MEHADHVRLLEAGVPGPGGLWADLGAGSGAFTLALAELIGPGATIFAVDRDRRALDDLQHSMVARFPHTALHTQAADFSRPLTLPMLDGVLLANSLHFQRRKEPVLAAVHALLRPGGCLLLVEYNADTGNPWVPFPLSFATWQDLAAAASFVDTRLLATVPSRFLREIYSAASRTP
jgi:SAM-dependent methyltransferase